MQILGAHMSIAGGFDRAVERGSVVGCQCIQVFTKNNTQWRAKRITDVDVAAFWDAMEAYGLSHPIAHSSYLINLASADRQLWKKSVEAFVIEMQRIEALRIPYLVIHPGSCGTSSEAQGMQRVIRALDEMDRQTQGAPTACLLETTAGQGSSLGWRFEQLAEMLQRVQSPVRFGVCLDTCHVFAAGYPLAPERQYQATFRHFNKLIGITAIKAFHLNDSKKPQGSRVDRHQHIGKGELGLEPFRLLLNDRRFNRVPKYLETPKEDPPGKNWDQVNLRQLRRLITQRDG